eukprot:2311672-Amphidinium_carterae.3
MSQKTRISVGVHTPLVETTIRCGAPSLPCLRMHVCSAFLRVSRPGLARDRSACMAEELAEGMPDFDVEKEVQPGAVLSGCDAADPQVGQTGESPVDAGQIGESPVHAMVVAEFGVSPARAHGHPGDSLGKVGEVEFDGQRYPTIAPRESQMAGATIAERNAAFNSEKTKERTDDMAYDFFNPGVRPRPVMRWVKAVGAWVAKHRGPKRTQPSRAWDGRAWNAPPWGMGIPMDWSSQVAAWHLGRGAHTAPAKTAGQADKATDSGGSRWCWWQTGGCRHGRRAALQNRQVGPPGGSIRRGLWGRGRRRSARRRSRSKLSRRHSPLQAWDKPAVGRRGRGPLRHLKLLAERLQQGSTHKREASSGKMRATM